MCFDKYNGFIPKYKIFIDMINRDNIKNIVKTYINEELSFDIDGIEDIKTDPEKGIVSPSKKVTTNVCQRDRICDEQGKITFGQLEGIINASIKKSRAKDIGEGVYKSFIRLLPWFVPQVAVGAFVGSGLRGIGKIIKPSLETTTGYKTWWGKMVLSAMKLADGDLNTSDEFSKIFFINDGLLEMLGTKYKYKFAKYVSEVASNKSKNEVVPEYFVENELRQYLNQKFILNPPLPLRENRMIINEGYKEVILTLGLLLGGQMALSQEKADNLLNNPSPDTVETISSVLSNKPIFNDYVSDVNDFGILKQPKLTFVDDWVKYGDVQLQLKPPVLTGGVWLVGVKFPIN